MFQKTDEQEDLRLIAKVYGYELHKDELLLNFPSDMKQEDSLEVVKNLINSWAKRKLLLKKAELNMPSENNELGLLVERYREDLFINSFKNALVLKQLDTVVSKGEVEDYYQLNKSSFTLNEELVKFKYIALNKKDKQRSKYRSLFLSKSKNDQFILDESKSGFDSFFLSDSIWFRYQDVKKKLPALQKFEESFVLKSEKFLATVFDGSLYYIYITDVKHRGDIAPLRYVYNTVRELVVHQRKLQLIKKAEEVLLDDAVKNNQFEIY